MRPRLADIPPSLRQLPQRELAVLMAAYGRKGLQRLAERLPADFEGPLRAIVAEADYQPKRLPASVFDLAYKVGLLAQEREARREAQQVGAKNLAPVPPAEASQLERHCEAVAIYCYDRVLEWRASECPPKERGSYPDERLWRAALRVGRRIAVEMDSRYQDDIETLRGLWVEIPLPARLWDGWAARRQRPPSRWYICYSLCPLPGPKHLHLGVEEWGY